MKKNIQPNEEFIEICDKLNEIRSMLNQVLRGAEIEPREPRFSNGLDESVLSILEQLKGSGLSQSQMVCVGRLEVVLKEQILSQRILSEHPQLSRDEVRIANYIKQGKRTKEIAGILCLSPRTVEYHRMKIRKKLGLPKDVSLSEHLSCLEPLSGVN